MHIRQDMPNRGYGARKPHQVSHVMQKPTKWVFVLHGETCSPGIGSPPIIKADLRGRMLPHGKGNFEKMQREREGGSGGSGARAAKLRLRKSTPGAKRRDTVCAEERSAFRKRLGGESVVGAKQGYRRRRYACPHVWRQGKRG